MSSQRFVSIIVFVSRSDLKISVFINYHVHGIVTASVHAINRILIYEPVVTRGESVTFVGKELPLATSHRAGGVRKDSILWGMLFYMLLLSPIMVTQESSSAAASMQDREASSLDKESSLRVADDPHQVPLYNPHVDISNVDERKLMRKIDLRSDGYWKTVQGLVHNYGGLLGMRWMLGVFEAGLFPGVNYYLSCWYKRSEFGLRAAVFFSAASVSGAFGGLLAAAISNMDGIGGKPAWAWIFSKWTFLSSFVAGVLSFWIVQDFPDTAKFLTEAERTVVIRRLQDDDQFSAAGEELRWKYIFQSLLDWKTWVGMICYCGCDMPLYAFALFLPSIINELGNHFSSEVKKPNNALGRTGSDAEDGLMLSLCVWVRGIGYIILIASRSPALSYFAVYLATCGIYPVIPNTIAWVSNNVEGSYKRSVTLAMVISFGNINGAVSSNVYRARDAPWYPLGHGLVLMYIVLGLVSSLSMIFFLDRENKARDRGERDEVIGGGQGDDQTNGRFATVSDAKREKGDAWSGYRYTL
ncbi:hypothetical protein Ac2012v2_003213 [Leucoagaricus gongylophorus]